MSGKPRVHKANPALAVQSTINPQTGRVWSLVDPEMHDRVDAAKARLSDPSAAREFLRDAGIITPKGRLTRRYGG